MILTFGNPTAFVWKLSQLTTQHTMKFTTIVAVGVTAAVGIAAPIIDPNNLPRQGQSITYDGDGGPQAQAQAQAAHDGNVVRSGQHHNPFSPGHGLLPRTQVSGPIARVERDTRTVESHVEGSEDDAEVAAVAGEEATAVSRKENRNGEGVVVADGGDWGEQVEAHYLISQPWFHRDTKCLIRQIRTGYCLDWPRRSVRS